MDFKLIKNENDYNIALAQLDQLILADNPKDDEKVELLGTLIDMYENEIHPIELPDPIEAIKFRVEQLGLSNKDLVPILGGKNRVSEVMNRKKTLTLKMMRALNQTLGIPAEVLLNEPKAEFPSDYSNVEWNKMPFKEIKKKYGKFLNIIDDTELFFRGLLKNVGGSVSPDFALYRKSNHKTNNDTEMNYALFAWCLLLINESKKQQISGNFNQENIDEEFLTNVVKLSYLDDGPIIAKEYLSKFGINLVFLPHLSKTYVDGVVIKTDDGPVVGMSLRYDRVDNFWFTLIHELSHIVKHYKGQSSIIVDDLDSNIHQNSEQIEDEANELTKKSLMYKEIDDKINQYPTRNSKIINKVANSLRISPAIIAGKIRHEEKNYRIYGNLVGSKEIRNRLMPTEIS